MTKLFDTLIKLGIPTFDALNLDKCVVEGGWIELYEANEEERKLIDSLRGDYRVVYYHNYIEIRKVIKM